MRNRRLNKISSVKFNFFGVEKFQVRQPSLIDSFNYEDGQCAETGEKTRSYHNPLYMLFNQERLEKLGEGALQMWLKQLDMAKNSAYNEVKSKLTDDEMLNFVKSRHIQHPSELESWLNYLSERQDVCNSEIASFIAQEKENQGLNPPPELQNNVES